MASFLKKIRDWFAGRKPEQICYNRWDQPDPTAATPNSPTEPAPPPPEKLPLGARFRPAVAEFTMTVGQMQEMDRLLETIPPLPQGAIQVLRELDSPDASAASVAKAIACEPVMAATVVRLSNSTAMGLRREINSVADAVAYLGFSTTKSLFLKFNVESLFPKTSTGRGYDRSKLWLHAMTVAQVAEEVARRAGRTDPNLALTAGLLHDVGKLVLNSKFENSVEKLWAPDADATVGLLDRERNLFGADHSIIGAMLAIDWKLPDDLVQIIRLHHSIQSPSVKLKPDVRRALLAVYVANQLVKFRHVYCDQMEIDPAPDAAAQELGLPGWPELMIDSRIVSIIDRALMLNGGAASSTSIAA
jgi:putative nucleotidyltransferase with HDIG domain